MYSTTLCIHTYTQNAVEFGKLYDIIKHEFSIYVKKSKLKAELFISFSISPPSCLLTVGVCQSKT